MQLHFISLCAIAGHQTEETCTSHYKKFVQSFPSSSFLAPESPATFFLEKDRINRSCCNITDSEQTSPESSSIIWRGNTWKSFALYQRKIWCQLSESFPAQLFCSRKDIGISRMLGFLGETVWFPLPHIT